MPRTKGALRKKTYKQGRGTNLNRPLTVPSRQIALTADYQEFEKAAKKPVKQLVPRQQRSLEHKDKFADKYDWGGVEEPTLLAELDKTGDPIVAFEPQLHRINRVLHYWLEQCHRARFATPQDKFKSIGIMAKALHENLRVVLEVVRLLHEIYDTQTFNRLVLDAIKAIAPEVRLKIVQKLQIARQELREMRTLKDLIPLEEEPIKKEAVDATLT